MRRVKAKRESEGTGVRELARIFNVPGATISRWVHDVPSEDPVFNKLRLLNLKSKAQYVGSIEGFKVGSKNAKLLASLLYWCEGSKCPSINFVASSNSDERLTLTFVSLLRKGFKLDESKFRLHLQLHSTHNVKIMTKYWSNLLDIPQDRFHKPTITHPKNNLKKRSNYNGTCTVKYFDVKLLLGLTGLYEIFAGDNFWKGGRAA